MDAQLVGFDEFGIMRVQVQGLDGDVDALLDMIQCEWRDGDYGDGCAAVNSDLARALRDAIANEAEAVGADFSFVRPALAEIGDRRLYVTPSYDGVHVLFS